MSEYDASSTRNALNSGVIAPKKILFGPLGCLFLTRLR